MNDFMSKDVVTVDQEESLHILLLLMVDYNISRVVVISDNESKRPVSIITSRDLVPLSNLLFDKATDEGNIVNKRRMK